MAISLYKWLLLLPFFTTGNLFSGTPSHEYHPYYVSVTEIEYSHPDQEIQVACKIFTDNFEQALKAMYHTKTDLYHPQDKALLDKQIAGYIQKHLYLKADNKTVKLNYVGYEIEGEAAWCFFSAGNIPAVKNIGVFNDILYEYKKEQVNMMHTRVNGNRKSARLSYPDTSTEFSF
ncbi:DUF6702 family protein [Agriterribacter sp.]|uniref:DUF6702 family protein n=1 Tax=Agriterribacter sp. TaxID=2821509 RepID=UPI002CC97C59|nr:DUF6702 family protein [Agriterribacter sp.]HRP54712.1 hypothetical protein [Agriterribacter sp.]